MPKPLADHCTIVVQGPDVLVTGAHHVNNLNRLTVIILDCHIWSLCCYFLSHLIFKVPAQLYLVILYNRSLLSFDLHQHWPFSRNPFSTAHVVIKTFKTLLCFFQVLIASSKHLTSRCQVHYSFNALHP